MGLARARAMAAGSVSTVPSCRVTEVRVPPGPGVMALTCTWSGTVWVTVTLFRVWPGAGVTVTVWVRVKFGPVTVSPSGMLTVCVTCNRVGVTMKLCSALSTRLGSWTGLFTESLPYSKPARVLMVRLGAPSE
ncbi:hypothetical protein D3C76_1231680 [compost metagenome]